MPSDSEPAGRHPIAWQPERPQWRLYQLLVSLIATAIAFMVAAGILPGVSIDDFLGALLVAVVVAALNAVIPPVLAALRLPLTLVLGFLLVLLADAGILLVTDALTDGVLTVDGFGSALLAALVVAAVSVVLAVMLGTDDTSSLRIAQRIARRQGIIARSGVPGIVFLEIDGLALPVLRRAISDRDAVVLGSGNLGLVYLMEEPRRLTLEEIDARHPELLPALREHPHVGWLLVRSSKHGAVALGPRGTHYLTDGRIEGEDPLAAFSPTAPRHLLRTDGFEHVGDIMVGSFYDPELEEGCAFEELICFHGGIGGPQTRPFILHPAHLQVPPEPIIGAASVHGILAGWRQQLQAGPNVAVQAPNEAATVAQNGASEGARVR